MRQIGLALAFLIGLVAQVAAQAPAPVPALPDAQRLTTATVSCGAPGQCTLSVGFALYGDGTDVDNWIQVYIGGTRYLSTDPTYGWTLSSPSGTLSLLPRPITNAIITFNSTTLTSFGQVTILGARRPRRLSQFAENRGVAARDLNQIVTDQIAVARETWDKLNRAIIGQPGEVLLPLPPVATRAGTYLCFDNNGNPISCQAISPTGTLTIGGGTPFTISAGDPPVGLSSQFFPPAARTTADPVIALQRDVSYSTGATASPTLSILTRANFTASTAWANGFLSEIILSTSTNDTAYVEAVRGVGSIGSGVTTHNSAWGGLFNAEAMNTAAYSTVQAVEAGVYQATGSDAAAPSATPLSKWAVSYVASLGVTVTAQNLVDAAFMINPFSTSGAQVGFYVPVEAAGNNGNGVTRVGNVIKYAAFAAANSSTYGIDIHLGTWATAAIWIPNNSFIQAENAAGNAAIKLLALNASNQIAVGAAGAQTQVLIDGNLAVFPTTGAATLTIQNQTATNRGQIVFKDVVTAKWEMAKETDNSFYLFDDARGQKAISIVSNGNMTLMGGGGTVIYPASTGTPAASLCLDASNNIIKKTTTGSCV